MFANIDWWLWLWTGLAIAVGVSAGLAVRWAVFSVGDRIARSTHRALDDAIVRALRGPSLLILPTFGVQLALTAVPLGSALQDFLRHLIAMLLIAGVAWLVISFITTGGRYLVKRYESPGRSPFAQRSLETRVHLLTRIISTLAGIVAAAIMLMTLPAVRELGTSILASAGIVGIVAGLAAQPVLGNLLAGVQLALTEPIRLGDAVVVEGEFGWVEEIGSTFVVVRIWDLRRLVIPLNYFLQHHFQNWTLSSSDLLGAAVLYVDHRAPIDDLRQELQRILEASSRWDRKVAVLQVTNTSERAVELRALMSAADPATLWDLRCEVREKLLAFVQQHHPGAIPHVRAEMWSLPNDDGQPARTAQPSGFRLESSAP